MKFTGKRKNSTLERLYVVLKFRYCDNHSANVKKHPCNLCRVSTYLSWRQRVFGQLLNEKSSWIKWEIREDWQGMNTVGRPKWEKEQSTQARKWRKKRSEGEKSRVVHFSNVKSINTEAQKKAFKGTVSYLSAFIFLFLSFLFHC